MIIDGLLSKDEMTENITRIKPVGSTSIPVETKAAHKEDPNSENPPSTKNVETKCTTRDSMYNMYDSPTMTPDALLVLFRTPDIADTP
jgi:hypothetical protein